MTVRAATAADAEAMSVLLTEILESWKSERPRSPDYVRQHYIEHPDEIQCSVAVDEDGSIIGFQSLRMANEGNPYGVTPGWGIIGTYVKLGTARRGVGRALFAASRDAALKAGVSKIDASIGETNEKAVNYYEAMGFRTYRTKPGVICKCCELRNVSDSELATGVNS
ncbi:GNAT family N-acetyltransferase [Rhizobium oryzicola]|uniref:GNAT family N-acetyltransferase n=1 Tax=Rhizobium oryzicola TaxID=1232668 RepID=A0ABT8SYT1_9HYPH|nr:GNAT family N-acetyltransferase [Rhizobium oryzicola]MDO1583635.1 GNAT family N-acetyltransferase [Rhizobium oryzicola]